MYTYIFVIVFGGELHAKTDDLQDNIQDIDKVNPKFLLEVEKNFLGLFVYFVWNP